MAIAERLLASLADRYRLDRELGAGGMATVYRELADRAACQGEEVTRPT